MAGITSALAFLSLSYFQRQLRDNVAAQQFVLVSSIAGNIDDHLASAQDELVDIAQSVPLDILQDPDRAQRYLDGYAGRRTAFDASIILFSRRGSLVAETPFTPGRRGKNFSFRDYFKNTLASARPAISAPFLSPKKEHHPVVTVTAPILDGAGTVVGMLAGSIDLTQHNFLGDIARTPVGKSGYLYLVSSERTIIMHPDRKRVLEKNLPFGSNRGFDRAVGGFEGTLETVNSKGVAMLASFKRLKRTDWILAANFPQAEAYAAIDRAKPCLYAALAAALVLSSALVWFYLKLLTAPLLRFTSHVRGLEAKEGARRLFKSDLEDEIGVLAEAFNQLVLKLDAERQALLKSQGLLDKAQLLAQVGNWELDLGTGKVTWSEEMYRIAGLERDGFDGTPGACLALIHPEEREAMALGGQEARQSGRPFARELRLVRPDGTQRIVHSITEVTFDAALRPVRMFGAVQDITQRKHAELGRLQAEEALRESEERLRQIAEHCEEVFFVVSSDLSETVYISPGYQKLWQASCQSAYQSPLSFLDRIHEEDRPRVIAALEGQARGGTFDQNFRVLRPDSTERWVHSRAYPVRAENGEVYRYVGISEDVTGQKLGEEQIRKLQQAVEQSPVAIVITDCLGRIEYLNPKFTQLTGYSCQEALGQNPRQLKSGPGSSEIFRQQREILSSGRMWHGELLSRKKNGETFWESVSISPIKNPQGEITHFLGVNEDISARKLMEQELQQAKELAEEASRLKSEFLANMSHEIRTPMNGVIGMTELLGSTDLDREQSEYVQAVKSSAASLLTVINDILDFSKIEAHKLDLESVNFELRLSLGSILHTLALRAAEKGLELAFRVPPEVPDALVGDPGRLRQIILNLVSNALKFTEKGEVVLRVTAEPEGDAAVLLHFAVADTGIGIAAEKLQRIFDPFAQADASTTRSYGGTGLGLSICAGLVQMMGGNIWVESSQGGGSTFHFAARLGLQPGPPVRSVPRELEFLQDLRVLVVDDNATNRRIQEEMLRNWRMRPACAGSGQEALALLAAARGSQDPFRLLLLDAGMPEMDGFQLAERINLAREYAGASIMMLSSDGRRGDAARCRELGISAYLNKPVGQSSLLDAILTALAPGLAQSALPPAPAHSPLPDRQRRLSILLVEDNRVNQLVALGMLKNQGHVVSVAANGKEAVAALASRERAFDLVLMDVQMPGMDGFETTALIRGEENSLGGHLPIIALTAHAMAGDRERCLAAGMDAYLAKPLDAEDLRGAIEAVLKAAAAGARKPATRAGGAQPGFHFEKALARMGGNPELFREVAGLFAEDAPGHLAEIRDAVAAGDSVRLSRAAHTLKGGLGYIGAPAPVQLALKLEQMGKGGELAGAAAAIEALQGELSRLEGALAGFVAAM